MDIKQLITFKTVIEEGSYTNAARRLAYTQSTISAHIQGIEQALGTNPFVYINKTLHLSAAGERLLPLCNQLLAVYAEIEKLKDEDYTTGTLKIAAPESLTIHYLPQLLRRFKEAYPRCQIVLTNASCGINQKKLLQEEADVAFMIWPSIKDSRYLAHPLMEVESVVVTAPRHSYKTFKEMLVAEPKKDFIINEKECSYRREFERSLATGDWQVPTNELWSIEAIKRAVRSDMGFSFLPTFTVTEELATNQLRAIPFPLEELLYAQMIVKKRHKYSQLVEAFMTFIKTNW